ncbi:hypothetical protein OJJOAM_004054 [Cupriavidus sp. H18C1]
MADAERGEIVDLALRVGEGEAGMQLQPCRGARHDGVAAFGGAIGGVIGGAIGSGIGGVRGRMRGRMRGGGMRFVARG